MLISLLFSFSVCSCSKLVTAAVSKPTPAVAEEEDDALSYFAKLAEE